MDFAAILEHGNKLGRANPTELRVVPSGKRLSSDHFAERVIDLRLVPHLDLPAFDCVVDSLLDGDAPVVAFEVFLREHENGAARFLARVPVGNRGIVHGAAVVAHMEIVLGQVVHARNERKMRIQANGTQPLIEPLDYLLELLLSLFVIKALRHKHEAIRAQTGNRVVMHEDLA